MKGRNWLILGGTLCGLAAVFHVGIILSGPAAFRYFDAPEMIIQWAESDALWSTAVTLCAAAVLMVWGLYAFSGAGLLRALPFQRTGLVVIASVFMLRGFAILPEGIMLITSPDSIEPRNLVFSLVSLIIGIAYLKGTVSSWAGLHRSTGK